MTKLEHAIKHIKTRADVWAVKEVTEALQSISERLDKALSQEPCDDAISRKKAIYVISARDGKSAQIEALEQLPSVTQKSGKWIGKDFRKEEYVLTGKCSVCGQVRVIDKFCSHCGARMESEE